VHLVLEIPGATALALIWGVTATFLVYFETLAESNFLHRCVWPSVLHLSGPNSDKLFVGLPSLQHFIAASCTAFPYSYGKETAMFCVRELGESTHHPPPLAPPLPIATATRRG
jgi:hypothetical protein